MHVAAMPWVFTQQRPLDSGEFLREAKRRGVRLDLTTLRELYRHRLIVPFIYVTDQKTGRSREQVGPEPQLAGTRLRALRDARDEGRLLDLAATPFRPMLPFKRKKAYSQRWWNGLIYSRYQLLIITEIPDLLTHRKFRRQGGRMSIRLPNPHPLLLDTAIRLRVIATVLTALEARYLPGLDPERVSLVNADIQEWYRYRESFDPVAIASSLNYTAAQAREDAEWLLLRADSTDPVGGPWSRLMRRAPRDSWKHLKDAALLAMEYREAAEILLRFYEEMADRGGAEPLPVIPSMVSHPLNERLSYRHDTLDQDLMALGISPHPRVVLAVEGESEEVHAPLVWKALGYPEAPELVRLLKLGGVDRDLEKVAALAAAPLVSGKVEGSGYWSLIKPPARLLVAVDPEGRQFGSPQKVNRTRGRIIREINAVLKAQGVENPDPSELDELVEIRTWSESCYEFAHFTDDEIADGIMTVHETINGLTRDKLVQSISEARSRRKDIKEVWSEWDYKVSKEKLARAIWPVLADKIDRCKIDPDAPIPSIAKVIEDAYHTAQRWRYHSFVLREAPGQ